MQRLTRRASLANLIATLSAMSSVACAAPNSSPGRSGSAESGTAEPTRPSVEPLISTPPPTPTNAPTPSVSLQAQVVAMSATASPSKPHASPTSATPLVVGEVGRAVGGSRVRPGIDVLLSDRLDLVRGKRLGLVTNPTGITAAGESDIDALHRRADLRLVALFAPEHGIRGDAADGAAIASSTDPRTGLPIHSLYGDTPASRRPTAAMLADLDALLFDIQDVGTRYYTFIYTMAYVMQAGAEYGKKVIVLDRPNPIGGLAVEGPILEPAQESFVGLYPIAQRHGMTIGELAALFNQEFGIHADLTIVPAEGWRRGQYFDQTGLPWVNPSPNIRDLEAAVLYAGVGLIEATNVSEGRGTAQPFKNVGAPWIDGAGWSTALSELGLPGVSFQPTRFTPTTSKYQGQSCDGVRMSLTNREQFRAVETGLQLIATARKLEPTRFAWQSGFRLMIGNTWVQQRLSAGASVAEVVQSWQPGLDAFRTTREKYLLYSP